MRKRRYLPVANGVWFRAPLWVACCDCGLVHRIEYRKRRGVFQLRVHRDARKTAAARRQIKARAARRR